MPRETPTVDVMVALAEAQQRTAEVLEQLAANAPKREVQFGDAEYQSRLRAEGYFDAFEAPVFQNGREVEPRGLKAETRERAPKLQPGKFLNGRVQVTVDSRGQVHLLYKNATPEERMRFAMEIAPDFDMLIDRIWREQQTVVA